MSTQLVARIKDALRNVIDPELGYNVVDLGFIYDIVVEEGGVVRITMTTTTPPRADSSRGTPPRRLDPIRQPSW